VGASIGSFLASWGIGWINLKRKKREDEEAANRSKAEKEMGVVDLAVSGN
jgi:hypothetical protein